MVYLCNIPSTCKKNRQWSYLDCIFGKTRMTLLKYVFKKREQEARRPTKSYCRSMDGRRWWLGLHVSRSEWGFGKCITIITHPESITAGRGLERCLECQQVEKSVKKRKGQDREFYFEEKRVHKRKKKRASSCSVLKQWFSRWGSLASSISIFRELIKNAGSEATLRSNESEIQDGTQKSVL